MSAQHTIPGNTPDQHENFTPHPEDPVRRRLLLATAVVGGGGLIATAVPFVDSLTPSARALAEGGPVEADISQIGPGELKVIEWRKQPIWLLRRTPEMLASLKTDEGLLSDPLSEKSIQPESCANIYRSQKPGLAVMIGICTHLGCSPVLKPAGEAAGLGADWPGGFLCPCHGSKFDLAGRVFRGVPAPTNLPVPVYEYLSDSVIRVGEKVA